MAAPILLENLCTASIDTTSQNVKSGQDLKFAFIASLNMSAVMGCQSLQAFYAIKLPFSGETTEETLCTTHNSKN